MSPLLKEYYQSLGLPILAAAKTVVESFNAPLEFQPGTSWNYGTGIDWAGLLIARISRLDLEIYFQQHIFEPLGISDATFWPDRHPEVKARLAGMSIRDPSVADGCGKAIAFEGPNRHAVAQEEMGGQGLYTSAPSYLKILQSLLDDDEVLLKNSTSALMFEPQLSAESQEALQAVYRSEPKGGPCAIGTFPPNVRYDWGLGGVLTMQDVNEKEVSWRKKGYLNWSGVPNFFWFMDRKAGVCGVFGAQLMPGGDVRCRKLVTAFEKAVFEESTFEKSGHL
ncbi:beta-lactamase [Cladophialophora psammophila CBS 110553]|uniref:Beta-lactamase n=1 Tax=Cladophialophora psammophila CBS 110553 TaxID=1182543 RepID=W9WNU6_9EURO|nr:beta-lactamase [Cladophialophora psammophila CBS 110553]EXJ66680.1 beta-lactamase [Cladophialophora psammophila CBS 110553]